VHVHAKGLTLAVSQQVSVSVQVAEAMKEAGALREELANARGKLSGLEGVRDDAATSARRAAQLEGQVEALKEALGDARAEAGMLRSRADEAEAEHKAVRSACVQAHASVLARLTLHNCRLCCVVC
jgi:predicted  nucleic acid-binding Zn-ribbon protein